MDRYFQSNNGTYIENLKADALDMNSKKITNVLDPTNTQDAATKNYVDTIFPGGTAANGSLTFEPNYAVPLTIPITLALQWENVMPLASHDSLNMTLDGANGNIVVQIPGYYLITGNITLQTAGANLLECGWGLNGADPLPEHIFGGTDASGSGKWSNFSFSNLHDLSTADIVHIMCRNYDGTSDIDMAIVNFNMVRIG